MSEPIPVHDMLCIGGPADGKYRRAPARHGDTFIETVMPPITDAPLTDIVAPIMVRRHLYEVTEWNFGRYDNRKSFYFLRENGLTEADVMHKLIEGYRQP